MSLAVYRLALLAFPSWHRTQFADEMTDVFARELDARRRELGRWRAFRFAVAACLNAVSEGLGERRRRRTSNHSTERRRPLGNVGRDLAHAIRALAKARAFTLVCVLSLGVGIGTVMAILIFMRVVFAPPPSVDADGLVELLIIPSGPLAAQTGGWPIDTWSYPDFVDVRDAGTGLTITGWAVARNDVRVEGDDAARLATMYVSPNYFAVTGVGLARGAGFEASAARSTPQPVVVISDRLWRTRFEADPAIIGRALMVNRVEHVVVGVAPLGFQNHVSPEESPSIDLWAPLEQHPRLQPRADSLRVNRDVGWLRVLGRLSPGTSLAQGDAAVASVMAGLAERYPATNEFKAGSVARYTAMGARLEPEIVRVKAMLLGVSGLVLLIVCLNVSGMVLVRSATRERELAVRLAIGASRSRLMQYLLSEAVVLALAGGSLAAAVLFGGPAVLAWWLDAQDNPDLALLKPDLRMALYGLGVCLVTSLVFGLLPAIRFSRPTLVSALKDEAGGGGRRVGRMQRLTAAVQAGIAVPFLVIGGVKLDEVRTTATADLGFPPQGLFAARLDASALADDGRDADAVIRSIRADLERAAGVRSVTMADGLPLDFRHRGTSVSREDDGKAVEARARAHVTRVADGYFETMGIRLLAGRAITTDDRSGSALVVVISEPLARRLFPDGSALGRQVTLPLEGNTRQTFTVVGVTADVVTSQMGTPRPQLFVPLAQHPTPDVLAIARSSADVESMASAFRAAFTRVDPDLRHPEIVTGDALVQDSMDDLLGHSTLATVCAAIALTLTALGVYGVVGFMVATRTREIGVRVALGAPRRRILRTVLFDAVKVVVPGVAGGLVLAVAWVRYLEPSWYPLGGVEPLAYAVAMTIAFSVAMLAGFPSARRAAAVAPLVAMRAE